jgi:hypothetical protein
LSVLYIVRCRFTDPKREDEWNEWYRGHLNVLLNVPGFLAAQRFRSPETVDQRPYLAMYEVTGPEVFTSEPYLAIWGFDEWRPLIDNWTRDIAEPLGGRPDFATPPGGHLRAAFVPGGSEAVRDVLESLTGWGRALVSGLDRSCGGLAWRVRPADGGDAESIDVRGLDVAEATYEPLTDCLTPASSEGAEVQ